MEGFKCGLIGLLYTGPFWTSEHDIVDCYDFVGLFLFGKGKRKLTIFIWFIIVLEITYSWIYYSTNPPFPHFAKKFWSLFHF